MKKFYVLIMMVSCLNMHAQCYESISATHYNSFSIKHDGTLWSWGLNYNGVLGIGQDYETMNGVGAPVQIGTDSGWAMIAAGKGLSRNAAAIKDDGTLWAWGRNDYGHLGDGTTVDKLSPVQIGSDTDWQYVSCGQFYMIALKNDGTLWSTGSNRSVGLLGTGGPDTNILTQISTDTDWASITCGQNSAFAIKNDGSLWGWGSNGFGTLGIGIDYGFFSTPVRVGLDNDWNSVSVDGMHVMALRNDGSMWTWGYNGDGQLGDGTYDFSNVPLQIGTDSWLQVAATALTSGAIRSDNTLWVWGSNVNQFLGTGNTDENENVPVQLAGQWERIYAGNAQNFADTVDGSLYGWGNNFQNQLGVNSFPNTVLTPALIQACALSLVENDQTNSLLVYPNPVSNILKFNCGVQSNISEVMILDMSGKIIMALPGHRNEIDLQHITSGIYIVKVYSEGNHSTTKFVKM